MPYRRRIEITVFGLWRHFRMPLSNLRITIKWTTDLGNAFLAQQSDVMDAVQRMRKKAQDAGNWAFSNVADFEGIRLSDDIFDGDKSRERVHNDRIHLGFCRWFANTRPFVQLGLLMLSFA